MARNAGCGQPWRIDVGTKSSADRIRVQQFRLASIS